MKKPEFVRETIYNAIQKAFREIRVCSLTTNGTNLLFWSHYADSHKGFCVEYDATTLPISYAFRVQYQDNYPEAIYPGPSDARGFKPALVKSKVWEYEEEYRIILVPEASRQPRNDGASLLLDGKEMTNVYLGAGMADENKQVLVEMIDRGPFSPSIWNASLSRTSFELVFKLREESRG